MSHNTTALANTLHWPKIADKWRQIGPPLRPCERDVASYTSALNRWVSEQGAPRALILGVTPELWRLRWPEGSVVSAVDNTPAMIENVWPGPRDAVTCANWTDMPFDAGAYDLVFCDGGLVQLSYPHDLRQLVNNLKRVLAPSGVCVLRLFVPPLRRETAHEVIDDLLRGQIANLNVLKLRLGMALQANTERGVTLASIWDSLHNAAPDFDELAERLGWPLEHLLVINAYRGCLTRYHFPTLDEVSQFFTQEPGGFDFVAANMQSYDLSERCPIVEFRRRVSANALPQSPMRRAA